MIAESRSNWKKRQVADLIAEGDLFIGDGYRAKNDELGRHGLPFARAGNIDGGFHFQAADRFPEENLSRVGNKVSRPGDVVFTSKGTVGRFAFVGENTPSFVYSPQLCFWRSLSPDVINPRFLYYWMFGREFFVQYKGVAGQTDMADYVSLTDQRRMHITVPPAPEQAEIVGILAALDEKIDLNQRMNETLESMAQAIFKSWFVDFDPVRSKVADQIPPDLDPEIAALFPDRFEQSDLGEMPAGWNRMPIFELAEINAWTLGKNDELDRMEYIEISEVSRGNIGNIQVFERGKEPSRARRRLRHGDTVMSTVRPDRGSYFLCLHPSPYSIASTGFAVITPTRAPWSFIHTAITRSDVFEHLGKQADGGAYPAISPEVIGKWQVTWPDQSAIVGAFHKMCGALYELAEENRRQSRTLARLRDALLPNLLSGQMRVSENQMVAEI